MRLSRLGIFRHFRMHNFTQWIGIQRHAAVFTVFGLEAAGVSPDIRHARALQQCDDRFNRTIRAFEFRYIVRGGARLSVLSAVKRPYDAVDYVVATASGKCNAIFVDTLLAESRNNSTQLVRRRAQRVEKITNGSTHRVRTDLLISVAAGRVISVWQQAFEFAAGQDGSKRRSALCCPMLETLAALHPRAVCFLLPAKQRRTRGDDRHCKQKARIGKDWRRFR